MPDAIRQPEAGGGATGAYDLVVTFTIGYLENPGPDSFQLRDLTP